MADSKIELRSEKVRHIIGEIPSGIVRYGITIITIVILVLLVGAYFIPYPETISARIEMTDRQQGTVDIPYKYVNTVKKRKERQHRVGRIRYRNVWCSQWHDNSHNAYAPTNGSRQHVHSTGKGNGLQV